MSVSTYLLQCASAEKNPNLRIKMDVWLNLGFFCMAHFHIPPLLGCDSSVTSANPWINKEFNKNYSAFLPFFPFFLLLYLSSPHFPHRHNTWLYQKALLPSACLFTTLLLFQLHRCDRYTLQFLHPLLSVLSLIFHLLSCHQQPSVVSEILRINVFMKCF